MSTPTTVARVEQMLEGLEELPIIQLHELVDELDVLPDAAETPRSASSTFQRGSQSGPPAIERGTSGLRAAESFSEVLQAAGLTAFVDLLTFCGVREELPHIFAEQPTTVFAPSNTALQQLSPETRADARLLRQIVFAHVCAGHYALEDLTRKQAAVALAGQTHAVYIEGEDAYHVGTARLGRPDLAFEGGVVHEVHSVMLVLQMLQESHSEQVWKKSLQPAPTLSVCGGGVNLAQANLAGQVPAPPSIDYEVHACLLHTATGQLVPESLRGHVRKIGAPGEAQLLTFSDIIVAAKPPSLTKRPGRGQPEGVNRYRLLFSLWNSSTLSYVTWQHMQTPIVVRNSFHMLPAEEKSYRRQLYARQRKGGGAADAMTVPPPWSAEEVEAAASAASSATLGGVGVGGGGGGGGAGGGGGGGGGGGSGLFLPPLPEGEPSRHAWSPEDGGEPGEMMSDELWLPLAALPGTGQELSLAAVTCAGRGRADSFTSTGSGGEEDWSSEALSLAERESSSILSGVAGDEPGLEPVQELQQLRAMGLVHGRRSSFEGGSARAPPQQAFGFGFGFGAAARYKREAVPAGAPAEAPPPAAPTEAEQAEAERALSAAAAAAVHAAPMLKELPLKERGERDASAASASAMETSSSSVGGAPSAANAAPPVLLDVSTREGSSRGGTALWVHGKRFSPEMGVTFGGVPAQKAAVVSSEVIKLVAPPCLPHNAHRRHQVLVRLVDRQTGAAASSSTLMFDYVPPDSATATAPPPSPAMPLLTGPFGQPVVPNAGPFGQPVLPHRLLPHAPAAAPTLPAAAAAAAAAAAGGAPAAPAATGLLEELLQRLAVSLERAHAAALADPATAVAGGAPTAPAAPAVPAVPAAAAASALQIFQRVDEHGYSLGEYVGGLRKMMDSLGLSGAGAGSGGERGGVGMGGRESSKSMQSDASSAVSVHADASELQMQHQELAALVTRERLSASLANRPGMERLQERNILPNADAEQQALFRRELLSNSLLNRPAPDRLQERNILQGPGAEQQAVARREMLSASLANRPAPDRLQERNILPRPEAGEQFAMKRKRLEGFLAERPPPEQVLWGGFGFGGIDMGRSPRSSNS